MAETDTNSQQQHLFPPFTRRVSTWPLSSLGTWLVIQAAYHRYSGTPAAPDLGFRHVNKLQDQDLLSLQMTCFSWQMYCTDTHNKASYNYQGLCRACTQVIVLQFFKKSDHLCSSFLNCHTEIHQELENKVFWSLEKKKIQAKQRQLQWHLWCFIDKSLSWITVISCVISSPALGVFINWD